jgi:hypothetical protein
MLLLVPLRLTPCPEISLLKVFFIPLQDGDFTGTQCELNITPLYFPFSFLKSLLSPLLHCAIVSRVLSE